MMEALARVESWEQGQVTLCWRVQSACGHCHESDSCGTGVIAKGLTPRSQRLTLPWSTPLTPGTQVSLGIPEQQLLGAAALVYLLPLLGLLVGVGGISLLGGAEAVALATGLGLALTGFMTARKLADRLTPTPRIIKVLGQPAAES
ncbi:transcriptional regulator [Ferrimonas sediminicola]|uniref:Transcriptional regulator n=1 Tax=Ferrimonas sediminicola TaxID=2569538 RepID=A0A4U1BEA4_9GAMM|nr:SoxR reducing system RseC family protein [Ferrimonas sediminicola]TKB49366.1 transcriptional regulator [Ferrimonas sediminicola]